MKYISGTHALNIHHLVDDPTPGDWHSRCLDWSAIPMRETSESVFGEWGVREIPVEQLNGERAYVATHARAILDAIESNQMLGFQGFQEDWICDDRVGREIMGKAVRLSSSPHWPAIDEFLKREYRMKWMEFPARPKAVAHV